MPNRIIKEAICTSDTVDQLTWFEECFFTRLWTACDDFGRFDARPRVLKGRLFPLKSELSDGDIEKALVRLVRLGTIDVYTVDGKKYLQIKNWQKHQILRSKKSKYPSPEDGSCDTDGQSVSVFLPESNCIQMPAAASLNGNGKETESESESESGNGNGNGAEPSDAPAPSAAETENISVSRGKYGWVKLSDRELSELNARFEPAEVLRSISYVDELAEQSKNRNGWRNWSVVVAKCAQNGWGKRRQSDAKAEIPVPEPRGPTAGDIDRMKKILEELG